MTGRRILLASANPWSFALAVERQVARDAIATGARVDLVNLFRLSGAASPHWRPRDVAIERINRKIERFVRPVIDGRDVTGTIRLSHRAIPPLPETPSIRNYRVDGAAVGLAVLGSVTSITTVQDPHEVAEYGSALPAAWRSAHLSQQVGRQIAEQGYDAAYIFNGRHCYSRPFCDVLEAAGTTVWRYEQGATGTSFVAAPQSIHHPATVAALIDAAPFDPNAGDMFYRDRLSKAQGDPVNFFTAGQREGSVPATLLPGEYVTFYSSSSDEMFAITDDLGFGRFATQFQAALAIAEASRRIGKVPVVRLHPHLSYKHASWRREWDFDTLRALGTIVLDPADPCDSYALAAGGHAVFTCGSTVGFECSYRGIPNADVGDWVGGHIGAMTTVRDIPGINAFVSSPHLPDGARDAALRYGSYVRTAGRSLDELVLPGQANFARIAGRLVDPVRATAQWVSSFGRSSGREARGIIDGKVWLDPTLEDRMRSDTTS